MEDFKVTRVFTGPNDDSYFEDIYFPLTDGGPIGYLSNNFKVENMIFRKVIPSYDFEFHNAPQKQFIILLNGEIEIETSLGDKRQFSGGEVLLVEDIAGKGHKTRNLKAQERHSVFITFK